MAMSRSSRAFVTTARTVLFSDILEIRMKHVCYLPRHAYEVRTSGKV